jgi:hypothetical protein
VGTRKRSTGAPKCRVTPEVTETGTVEFNDLDNGDAFICNGDVWMKCDIGNQDAIRLRDGDMMDSLCDEGKLIPVDIQVTWKRK